MPQWFITNSWPVCLIYLLQKKKRGTGYSGTSELDWIFLFICNVVIKGKIILFMYADFFVEIS